MFIPLSDTNGLKHIRLQYVTLIIIAANCLIWLAISTPAITDPANYKATVYAYGFIPAVINGYQTLPVELHRIPETTTYISYAFFHGDFMHLAGNMLFIWVFGDNIEDAMGHLRYLFFYLACAAVGALAHNFYQPQSDVPLIGASGSAAGIVSAYLLLHPKVRVWVLALGRIPLRIPAVFVLGAWILFQFYQFYSNPESQVSWAAHIGGIIAGAVLILFLKRPEVPLFDRDLAVVQKNRNAPQPTLARKINPDGKPASVSKTGENSKTSVPDTGTKAKIRWGRGKSDEN